MQLVDVNEAPVSIRTAGLLIRDVLLAVIETLVNERVPVRARKIEQETPAVSRKVITDMARVGPEIMKTASEPAIDATGLTLVDASAVAYP